MMLKYCIAEFLEEKKFQNISPKTLQNYSETLAQFYSFSVENEVIEVLGVTTNFIKKYLTYCKVERNNKPVSLNSKLLILKVFFNYLEKEEIISSKENSASKIKYLKTDVNIAVPTDEQIRQMLKYFRRLKGREKTFYSMRDSMIIIILISTGLRLSEMLSIKWSEIDFEHGYLLIFGKSRVSQGVPISQRLKQELLEYRIYCDKHFKHLPEYVFTNHKGQPSTPDAVKNVFKRLNEVLQFKDISISAHKLMHYYASVLVKNGVDGFTLMGLLRHQNISTSQRYVKLFNGDLSIKNERFNPLNNLEI